MRVAQQEIGKELAGIERIEPNKAARPKTRRDYSDGLNANCRATCWPFLTKNRYLNPTVNRGSMRCPAMPAQRTVTRRPDRGTVQEPLRRL